MHTPAGFTVLMIACLCVSCGDDGTTTTVADGTSSATTTDTGTETGTPIPCGESECPAAQVCLTFPQAPPCQNKLEDEPCPEGTSETACGGAGIPCCCGPAPTTITECSVPAACGDIVDCDCLVDVCIPSCSGTANEGVFICEELPAP